MLGARFVKSGHKFARTCKFGDRVDNEDNILCATQIGVLAGWFVGIYGAEKSRDMVDGAALGVFCPLVGASAGMYLGKHLPTSGKHLPMSVAPAAIVCALIGAGFGFLGSIKPPSR